ncbi:MAG: hypothetical protein ACRC6I_01865 [Paracoccaceae bacterium]
MTDEHEMPHRLWARRIVGAMTITHEASDRPRHLFNDPYILATPEALAEAPEVQALLAKARREGEIAGMERVAKICQRRIDEIIRETGNQEWDTGFLNLPEWAQTSIDEIEGQIGSIRAAAQELRDE